MARRMVLGHRHDLNKGEKLFPETSLLDASLRPLSVSLISNLLPHLVIYGYHSLSVLNIEAVTL